MRLLLLFFLIIPLTSNAQLTGKVVSVTDGDSFTLLTSENKQIKISLHGIDCPEKNQDFGEVAKKLLSYLIFDKTVSCEQTNVDEFGKAVAIVMVDSVNINERLLQGGLAWHYKRYDQNPHWAKLEEDARARD